MIRYFSNQSIYTKFLYLFIPISLMLLILSSYGYYYLNLKRIEESEITLLQARTEEFFDLLDLLAANNYKTLAFIASNEQVKTAYLEKDNEEGVRKLKDFYNKSIKGLNFDKKEFQLHFHKPPAISFWRSFMDKRNDDLSKFRKTIVKTYETKQPVVGLEHGVVNFGLRTILPIFDNSNNYLGSVEIINDLPNVLNILNKNKKDTINIITLAKSDYLGNFVAPEYIQKNYPLQMGAFKASAITDSNFKLENYINSEDINRVLKNKEIEYAIFDNYVVALVPIVDFNREIPGLFILSVDISKHLEKAKTQTFNLLGFFILLFAIIVAFLLFMIKRFIIKPIELIKQRILNISEGIL